MMKTSPSKNDITEKELDKTILEYEHCVMEVRCIRVKHSNQLRHLLAKQESLRSARNRAVAKWIHR